MNPGGVVILIFAAWIGCQVFGGNALERLGVIAPDDGGTSSGAGIPGQLGKPGSK